MKGLKGIPHVDLFAGCGGLSLGLEEAGFVPVFVNELNADAMATYLQNRLDINPRLSTFQTNDVKDLVLDPDALDQLQRGLRNEFGINCSRGELPLLVGGPPCQGFSGIGHRRSFSVEKRQLPSNHLYQDMAYVISRLRPKIFLFENVRGLLFARWTKKGSKGEIWNDVLGTFRALPDYEIYWSMVYAKDYGVPQNRPRVLLVGVRSDLDLKFRNGFDAVERGVLPSPNKGYPDLSDLLGDLVDKDYQNGGETRAYPRKATKEIQESLRADKTSGRPLGPGAPVTEHAYSKHSDQIVRKFRYMLLNEGRIPPSMQTKKFAQRVLPAKWNKDGPSITATSLADDYVHYAQPRVLTVREWARLQLFPDWYAFAGKRTTGGVRRAGNPRIGIHDREVPKYTQIGNAVPVGLARAIGKHFRKLLESV